MSEDKHRYRPRQRRFRRYIHFDSGPFQPFELQARGQRFHLGLVSTSRTYPRCSFRVVIRTTV
jgi:hypothetical protein